MATLTLRDSPTTREGEVTDLVETMVTSVIKHTKHRPAALRRYAELSVRAAIRRDGWTDAGHRLVMSPLERKAWERDNPLPQW